MEVMTEKDIRHLDAATLSREVNRVIQLNLDVKKVVLSREDAKKIADLKRVPSYVSQVTMIDINNFDKSPCADPHVRNTSKIGRFELTDIKRVGHDRYRFSFRVF